VLTLELTGRIWLCADPVDGRKSFDGLAGVVTAHLNADPLGGDLFVFKNRRRSAQDPGLAGRRLCPVPAAAGARYL
jgi:transposase